MATTDAVQLFDDNGWAERLIEPRSQPTCWSLISPEQDSRMDGARLARPAERFFATVLTVSPNKRYPGGGWPLADEAVVAVTHAALRAEVSVRTLPLERVPETLAAANRGVVAIGGAGFDALVKRGRRVWQIDQQPLQGDERGPLLVAAVLASVLLAPIVPPAADAIFGVKGARERLAALGLKT